jgi:hypothetical protein
LRIEIKGKKTNRKAIKRQSRETERKRKISKLPRQTIKACLRLVSNVGLKRKARTRCAPEQNLFEIIGTGDWVKVNENEGWIEVYPHPRRPER